MKTLSIRQPWAYMIVRGYKPVENRSWITRHRGPTLIHAGQKFDHEGLDFIKQTFPEIPLPTQWDLGGIVGKANLTDCVTGMDSKWFFGDYGFVFENAEELPFKPCKGQLGFFEVEDGI